MLYFNIIHHHLNCVSLFRCIFNLGTIREDMCAFEEVTNAPEPAEYRPTTPMPTNFSTTPVNTYEREGGVGEIDGILLGGDSLLDIANSLVHNLSTPVSSINQSIKKIIPHPDSKLTYSKRITNYLFHNSSMNQ